MNDRARAVILRTRQLSETSLIVHWLTLDQGRFSTVARGAQRPKSAFRGKLDLLHECEILVRRSKNSDLHNLGEARLIRSWPALRSNLHLLRQASCAIRWIETQTETDTPIPDLYELFIALLDCLETSQRPAIPLLSFELRFLELLGQAPEPDQLRLSTESKIILRSLLAGSWDQLPDVAHDSRELAEIKTFLHGFLIYHLGKVPTGRNTALAARE